MEERIYRTRRVHLASLSSWVVLEGGSIWDDNGGRARGSVEMTFASDADMLLNWQGKGERLWLDMFRDPRPRIDQRIGMNSQRCVLAFEEVIWGKLTSTFTY